ncbi:DNA-directed DNA polymerase [Candidatus Nanohalovita haloferacivicina]|uniref:DNA-directed DNA polymerase n=1 Tax=Candidatus Nanohalovita haloferacivicina TaxID=2978046 RepID=UPI00325F9561|nr:DNA polymerase PolB3 [Candidatus Nanohalobia archaeon BNXNv]
MRIETQVIDGDYRIEDEEVFVRLFCRSGEKNIIAYDRDFRPYFYALPSEESDGAEDLEKKISDQSFSDDDGEHIPLLDTEVVEKIVGHEARKAVKVYTNIPANVPKLKNGVWDLPETERCREFDIPFYRRYLIDKRIRPGKTVEVSGEEADSDEYDIAIEIDDINPDVDEKDQEYVTMAFDLEVYQDKIIMASMKSEGFEKVLSLSEVDRPFVESVEDEEELLERFIEIIQDRDVDILTGYNTDEFDFSVLRDAAERNNVTLSLGRDGERMKFNRRGRFSAARLKGRAHLDLYPFVDHVLSPGMEAENLDLDSVAEELLGENKDDLSWEEMKESWEEQEDLEKFADYCLKDSDLALRLSEEIVPQVMELSKIVGTIPFDTCRLTYGQLTENFLLREAFERDMIAPNRPSRSKRSDRRNEGAYAGGFVYTPESGLHENIALFDFRSLYPTVMVAHNISPDTLNLDNCSDRFTLEDFEYDFCQDEQGFFPELIEGLVEERYEIKSEMKDADKDSAEYQSLYNRQQAEKILANSFYGYLGYNGARWYSRECAEATTYMGRKYIEDTIETAEDLGLEVVYGDTDSVFLKGDNIRERMDGFLDEVNDELPEFMELEFEGFFRRGLFTSTESGEGAKKKYALIDEDGEMKITGFEQVRRDWSPIAKETQKKVLQAVLEDDVDRAVEVVEDTIEELQSGEVPVEKLKIYTTLTKPPEEYGSTAPHVEAAKKAKKKGDEIKPESTITYVITSGGGTISDRARLLKYADSYDSEYYVDNQVLPVAMRVLKVFGYTEDQLKGKGKQSGLDRFS